MEAWLKRQKVCQRYLSGSLFVLLAINPWPAFAEGQLRIAVYESLGYPLSVFDEHWTLRGGLQKEFGDRIARLMDGNPVYIAYSRKRIENAVISGEADLLCYTSPKWFNQPAEAIWSAATIPQLERIVVLSDKAMLENFPEHLLKKKLATQIGYHYPEIDQLVESGQIKRLDQASVAGMFRMLEVGAADALIGSETEIEGYFKKFPEKRTHFNLSKNAFSILQTQCALSAKSSWRIESLNQAIRSMHEAGEISRMMRNYGLSDK